MPVTVTPTDLMNRPFTHAGVTSPHGVLQPGYVLRLMDDILAGDIMPPIPVLPSGRAVDGTHRLAAFKILGLTPPTTPQDCCPSWTMRRAPVDA